jgi:hypothetical protein
MPSDWRPPVSLTSLSAIVSKPSSHRGRRGVGARAGSDPRLDVDLHQEPSVDSLWERRMKYRRREVQLQKLL